MAKILQRIKTLKIGYLKHTLNTMLKVVVFLVAWIKKHLNVIEFNPFISPFPLLSLAFTRAAKRVRDRVR